MRLSFHIIFSTLGGAAWERDQLLHYVLMYSHLGSTLLVYISNKGGYVGGGGGLVPPVGPEEKKV